MDFEEYIKNLKLVIKEMEESQKYDLLYSISPPTEDIEEMEDYILEELDVHEFHVWDTFKKFYKVTRGFTLRWTYRGLTDENYITTGNSSINTISAIYYPEEQIGRQFDLYENYRIFDTIGEENHVAVKFVERREEPKFYYYDKRTESYYLMSLTFTEYLKSLQETRALYPWQQFFITDKNFTMDTNQAQKFIGDLELLFPDVDRSKFRGNKK